MPRSLSASTYPILELVLHQKLQRSGLEDLFPLHGRCVGLEPGVNSFSNDILELVVGPQVLLWPFGKDVRVDAALRGGRVVSKKI